MADEAGLWARPARLRGFIAWPGGLASCVALAFAAVAAPWVTAGVCFGLLLLTALLISPLGVVGLMLVLGPVDLSFLTGGFKSLFRASGGLDMNGIRLVGICAGFMALTLFQPAVWRTALSPQGRWYVLFLLWGAGTLASSFSANEGVRLLFKLAYPLLLFVVVVGMVQRREQLDRLLLCALGSGALIALVINPIYVLSGTASVDVTGIRRIRGFGTHENPFSFYLLIILLISYTRFLIRGQWRYVALCLVLGGWIILTVTRITMAAAFASMVAIAFIHALSARRYRTLLTAGAIVVVLGIPLLPAVLERSLGFVPSAGELLALVSDPVGLYEKINWQGRQVLWPIVYSAFLGDPWTGLGLGSSTVVVRLNFPAAAAQVVHNEYLRLLTDTGLIGGALFFAAMMAWLAAATRAAWTGSAHVREFALPAVGGIIAWSLISVTDNAFDYYSPFTQYVGFLCAGAVVSHRLMQRDEASGIAAA